MTAPTEDVDWAAVDRRGRRLPWLAVPAFALFALAYGSASTWGTALHGTLLWALPLLAVVVLASVALVGRRTGRRAKAVDAQRIQYAVRHHTDPGPELRERTDQQATHFARLPWLGAAYPLLALTFALNADWDHAVSTAVAVAVVAAFFLGLAGWWTVQARAARRWLADPPGPARVVDPDPSARRWRWLGIVAVTCLALGLLLGLLVALLD